ncbi:FxsA family protein [Porticoccus sp.]|uniref:FxsA family protein n=1 Tax=Porticoccus sp. TaxID=2024853 RepID=UPI000C500844|nr:FxsA family protein [Porticoccus sp.]MAZ68992.1 biotin--acetyl-CoA-carboxylase ligase [Porticoccus sp.]
MRYLLLLFIVMPVVEMWLLITVGRQIGAWPTIGLVLLTAVVGVALLRAQGFATLFRARQKMDVGELPAMEMAEAIVLAVCGALLLTPGFATDVLGFAGLTPPVRYWLVSRFVKNLVVARHQPPPARDPFSADQAPEKDRGKTLEGEFWRDQDEKK